MNYKMLVFEHENFMISLMILHDQCTVWKKRDPAILDREELFLQLEIEEIFFSEE